MGARVRTRAQLTKGGKTMGRFLTTIEPSRGIKGESELRFFAVLAHLFYALDFK